MKYPSAEQWGISVTLSDVTPSGVEVRSDIISHNHMMHKIKNKNNRLSMYAFYA